MRDDLRREQMIEILRLIRGLGLCIFVQHVGDVLLDRRIPGLDCPASTGLKHPIVQLHLRHSNSGSETQLILHFRPPEVAGKPTSAGRRARLAQRFRPATVSGRNKRRLKLGRVPKWTKGTDCKSVIRRFESDLGLSSARCSDFDFKILPVCGRI
jgi:hypothetical protein